MTSLLESWQQYHPERQYTNFLEHALVLQQDVNSGGVPSNWACIVGSFQAALRPNASQDSFPDAPPRTCRPISYDSLVEDWLGSFQCLNARGEPFTLPPHPAWVARTHESVAPRDDDATGSPARLDDDVDGGDDAAADDDEDDGSANGVPSNTAGDTRAGARQGRTFHRWSFPGRRSARGGAPSVADGCACGA